MTSARITLVLLLGLRLLAVVACFDAEAGFGAGPRDSAGPAASPTREIAFVSNVLEGNVSLVDLAARPVLGVIDIKPEGARVCLFREPLQAFTQVRLDEGGGLNCTQDTDLSRDGPVLPVSRGHLGDVAPFGVVSGTLL